ncbi:MAG: CDP-alcohol phosphatidyltransferase family protein [Chloroflexi bacterium]|nr:CDP-alcohol phosphatidyltransferase family protein [Chloroflexota bacterium]
MPPAAEGHVSRYLNRRLSRPLARLLSRTPATPNQVSCASLGLAAVAGACFAVGWNVPGGLLAQANSIVDGADGDLARLKGRASSFGGFLDAVLDRYADGLILLGLILWAEGQVGQVAWLAGFWALVGTLSVSYVRARPEAAGLDSLPTGAFGLATRDVRLLLVMVGGVAGQALATLLVLALLTNGAVALRLLMAYRAWRALLSPQAGLSPGSGPPGVDCRTAGNAEPAPGAASAAATAERSRSR